MKFYILCDIEGVASLTCWDEARSANACYAPMAREMALEAAAAARGLFSGGADEVVIEDMHGDGCNIDCALLPRDARLLRGITHDIVGLTGIFDESYDGMLMVGFHDAASAPGNPTSHTMVSSRIFRLTVNGALWGEFEMYAHAAAYRGVPTLFASGDEGMCAAAARTVPGLLTVPTKSGHGYGVLTKTPELVCEEIEGMMAEAVAAEGMMAEAGAAEKPAAPPVLPDHFHVEVTYIHHYDAYGCSHYPGASLISPTTLAFDADDYGDVLRFFYFVI
ncbi:putative uncharacterized protein [Firmicutes bacterium CAG:83]|nr:putative uncharacterized protein [Firmicutes bacterium CAG:83]